MHARETRPRPEAPAAPAVPRPVGCAASRGGAPRDLRLCWLPVPTPGPAPSSLIRSLAACRRRWTLRSCCSRQRRSTACVSLRGRRAGEAARTACASPFRFTLRMSCARARGGWARRCGQRCKEAAERRAGEGGGAGGGEGVGTHRCTVACMFVSVSGGERERESHTQVDGGTRGAALLTAWLELECEPEDRRKAGPSNAGG